MNPPQTPEEFDLAAWLDAETPLRALHPSLSLFLRASVHGNNEAFGMFCDLTLKFVFEYAYFRTNCRTLANNAMKSAYLLALTRRYEFLQTERKPNTEAWILRIVHEVTPREPGVPFGLDIIKPGDVPAAIVTAITLLDPLPLECIMLRDFFGFDVRTIAEILSQTPKAVSKLHCEARKSIRLLLPQG